jgi:enoyl-CoA hydratase/carnithine racemase
MTFTRFAVNSLAAGPTGFHPWVDVLVRVSRLPAVTISAIRGRARAAGSELVLVTDIRFASRERAVLGHVEVGFGAIPGGEFEDRLQQRSDVELHLGEYVGQLQKASQ